MNIDITLAIGKNLRKLRLKTGYSQEEISYYLEVTQTTYSKWESDLKVPTIKNLVKASKFFNVGVEDLIYDKYGESKLQQAV
jgi:transcriptional regulator with XRE-family HTH domain